MYTIGLDFGTLSGRAVLVDARNGGEVAESVFDYPHGVMDGELTNGHKLPPDWALQHPQDYLDVFAHTVPAVLRGSGVDPADVKGIAIDFTASSPMPTTSDGTPLCFLSEFRDEPHAYIKLWKHHAAQRQADQINETARQMGETWLPRYGGKISSEWFFSKLLQILQERPDVYARMGPLHRGGRLGDLAIDRCRNAQFLHRRLQGDGTGWRISQRGLFQGAGPSLRLCGGRESRARIRRARRQSRRIEARNGGDDGAASGSRRRGRQCRRACNRACRQGDRAGRHGHGHGHLHLPQLCRGTELGEVEGMCGVVMGGIIPGLYGYEAGQSAVGDIFAWYVENGVPPEYHAAARQAGLNLHEYLEREAAKQSVGEHGLIALDWWNGNRSTLVDVDLTGMMLGMNLATRAPDIYRALIEATAFGTREIIEAFEAQGVEVRELVAAGGLPEKNALLRQIYADVTGRTFKLSGSAQAPALGSAMHAAVAAGIYPDIQAAAEKMGKLKDDVVSPIAENQAMYDRLYAEYRTLYDYFGRGANDVMKRLKAIKHEALN